MNDGGGFIPATSRHLTRRSVAWVGGLLIAIIIAMAAFDIVRSYQTTVEETGRELETQARIIGEQTARSVQAIDVVLRHIATEFRGGRLSNLSAAELHEFLNEQAVGLVQIDGFAMHDALGDAMAISWLPLGAAANLAHFEGFAAVRDDPKGGLLVGPATRSPTDGQWVIPFLRRLETPTGQFAGAIGARGSIDYFQQFYRNIRLDPGTKVTLMHRNATLIARYPPVETALGRHFPIFETMLAMRADGRSGPTRTISPVDGVERFGAVSSVPGLPLEVLVTRDTNVALASWRRMAWGAAARTLALAALAVVLIALLMRQLSRLAAVRDSLNTSHERFELAVAGSNDGIWDWDARTHKVFASARARELLGLPGCESVASDDLVSSIRFHPDDEPRRLAALKAHLAGTTPLYEGEYRVRHPDGIYRWVRISGMCVRAAGHALRMAGSVSDIDAQKRAEEALRVSEQRYSIAMTGSNEGHWVWNILNDELYASPIVKEIFGLAADEPVTTRTAFLARIKFHPGDRELVDRNVADHVEGRTPRLEHEFRIILPDGAVRWIQTRGRCFRDAESRPVRMAGASIVVTERKRAEEALRQSEQRYQLVIAGVNQGVWDWDLASDMVFMSARAQELLGTEPGALVRPRRECIELWGRNCHPEDHVRVRQALADYLHGTARTFEVEYRLRHPSGTWRWYHDRGVALRDETGRPYRMAGSIEDVTDRKEAEAQRDRLEGQLRQAQKLEAMGTLAGGVAHDFNNILAAILGYGEMAQKEAVEGTSLRHYVDAAMSAGMRAKSLVQRILAFSRSGMGERVQVHVQSVVADALDIVEGALPPGVMLERTLAASDAAVLGDPTQLQQVVMNLCSNAVQAIEREGGVFVLVDTVVLKEQRLVTTCSLRPGEYVRLRIADSGTGIDPQVIHRIFDPFFTTKGVGVGTGLGLSLVHGIVTDLGGGIDVESEPGSGASFTVYVPRQGNVEAPTAIEQPLRAGGGETIMLVDDETTLVRLGEEMMAKLGYEPVGFSSSIAALESFRNAPDRFDVVLSDEAMPGMTGSELAEQIHRIRPNIPIVLTTGFTSAALATRARDAGVIEVLAKPLVAHDIARCLAHALRH